MSSALSSVGTSEMRDVLLVYARSKLSCITSSTASDFTLLPYYCFYWCVVYFCSLLSLLFGGAVGTECYGVGYYCYFFFYYDFVCFILFYSDNGVGWLFCSVVYSFDSVCMIGNAFDLSPTVVVVVDTLEDVDDTDEVKKAFSLLDLITWFVGTFNMFSFVVWFVSSAFESFYCCVLFYSLLALSCVFGVIYLSLFSLVLLC